MKLFQSLGMAATLIFGRRQFNLRQSSSSSTTHWGASSSLLALRLLANFWPTFGQLSAAQRLSRAARSCPSAAQPDKHQVAPAGQ